MENIFKWSKRHEIKCKTCNIMLSIDKVSEHVTHDVRVGLKLKNWLVGLGFITFISSIPMFITWYVMYDLLLKVIQLKVNTPI